MKQPQFPIYVISKGRHDVCLTAKFLEKDKVDYRLVVEPQEQSQYAEYFDPKKILVTPFSNLGQGSIPVRNFVWEHSKEQGFDWHWVLDDNIRCVYRSYKKVSIRCNSGIGFRVVEDFTLRYENIGIAGLNYSTFVNTSMHNANQPPFRLNAHVYSACLIRNDLPMRWRGRYNEDTDLCLQVLANGWCTVLVNAFSVGKVATLTMKGGNMTELYRGDGRLRMARSLERQWPYISETRRRFNRPQHWVHSNWSRFDTPLKRRTDIDWSEIPNSDEYGLQLKELTPIQSESLQNYVKGVG
jgi:hypothetical protein